MNTYTHRRIATSDGHELAARLFVPHADAKGGVLIVPAMGVTQQFYVPFASWLMANDFLAVTFDYRGIGSSRPGALRGFEADILDWANQDCAAMLAAVSETEPGKPLYWIGHSLGGQIFPFVPNRELVSKMITVASGSGYWRENSPSLRRMAWWLWYVVVPLSIRLFGYFPGKRLRKVGDLPRGVMEQWRRWCLNSEYAIGAEGDEARALYASVTTPVTSFSLTDDEYMSARSIDSLHRFYRNAPSTIVRIKPHDIGVARIGHFGFFRPAFEESLWTPYLLPELRRGAPEQAT
ncbi:MAG: alpha/beta hydrolase family protein [Gammaproteobacteria bacterium]